MLNFWRSNFFDYWLFYGRDEQIYVYFSQFASFRHTRLLLPFVLFRSERFAQINFLFNFLQKFWLLFLNKGRILRIFLTPNPNIRRILRNILIIRFTFKPVRLVLPHPFLILHLQHLLPTLLLPVFLYEKACIIQTPTLFLFYSLGGVSPR